MLSASLIQLEYASKHWKSTFSYFEEEVSDAFPQGGRLDQGGRPDALEGAGGAEAPHVLVPESREVLPYRCGVV